MPTMLKARSFTGTQIATVMSLFGLAIFAGRIITGLLLDRFWAPGICAAVFLLVHNWRQLLRAVAGRGRRPEADR